MRVNAADLPGRLEANGVQVLDVWTADGFESIQIGPEAAMRHTMDHIETKLALGAASDR